MSNQLQEIKNVWDLFVSDNDKIDQLTKCLAVSKEGNVVLSMIINNKIYDSTGHEIKYEWLADAKSIIKLITSLHAILEE